MKTLLNTKKSWLPVLGLASLLLGLVGYLFLGDDFIQGSRNYSDVSLWVMMFAAVILAPVLEELFFRGFFTFKKWLRWVGLIGIIAFILLDDTSLFKVCLLLGFLGCYFAYIKYRINILQDFAILLNILLFTIVHYKLEELIDPNLFFFAFFQFGIGAFLVWLVLNFGLLKAIFFHAGWNTLMMVLVIIGLQFPDDKLQKFENSVIRVEWSRSPRFDNREVFVKNINNNDTLIGSHVEARFLYQVLIDFKKSDTLKGMRLLQTESYMRYNFKAVPKDGKNEVFKEALKDFLIEEKLIYFF